MDDIPNQPEPTITRNALLIAGGVSLLIAAVVGIVLVLTTGRGNSGTSDNAPAPPTGITTAPTNTLSATEPPENGGVVAPPPDEEAAPLPTLEPYEYTVQPGETLLFIIQLFGYRDTSIIPEVLVLNGLPNENSLQEGQTLLIPRQTPTPGPSLTPTLEVTETPTPEGLEETAIALATEGILPTETPIPPSCSFNSRCVTTDGQYYRHIVSEGETAAGIVFQYNTRYDDFVSVNGLSAADPVLQVGQELLVPILVTATPTLTPTGGPNSTATPTPTPSPPTLLAPANGIRIPRSDAVVLQWVPVSLLQPGQLYLVEVRNPNSGEIVLQETTNSNTYPLPESLQPDGGNAIVYSWRVVVVEGQNLAAPVSGQGVIWQFTWGN